MTLPASLQTSPFYSVDEQRRRLTSMRPTAEDQDLDDATLALLLRCSEPRPTRTLLEEYPAAAVESAFQRRLLVDSSTAWDYFPTRIEVETSTHCNWRCTFCPQSIDPKPLSYMEPALFDDIIAKAERFGHFTIASFVAYNEPTLDKYFEDRIARLASTPMKLQLHSNGSGLTKKRIDLLRETGILSSLYFNLPSLDPDEFTRMTGADHLPRVVEHIQYAVERGLPVNFSVQGPTESSRRNYLAICAFFGLDPDNAGRCSCSQCQSTAWQTTDRAGSVTNEFFLNVQIDKPRLNGCGSPLEWLYVSVKGDCFLCCEDYRQRSVYGRIQDGEIADILRSETARRMIGWVFGAEDAPSGFVCRTCVAMKKPGDTLVSLGRRASGRS